MRRTIVLAAFFGMLLAQPMFLQAQQTYTTGLGLRGGYPSGITLKHFLSQRTAFEGILSFGGSSMGITGLYQIHLPIPDARGFRWYYGLGGHMGIAFEDRWRNPYGRYYASTLYLGIAGVIGAEYTFAEAPLTISLDVIPTFNLFPGIYAWFLPGLSIRYNF